MSVKLNDGAQLDWSRASLKRAVGVPAGWRLVVRLLQPLSSSTAKNDMPVAAVLISPALVDGKLLIPSGATLKGKVTKAQPVGMAVVHETAALSVEFNQLHLPNGDTRALHCRLYRVENSREKVDGAGTIHGIRSTGTLGYAEQASSRQSRQLIPWRICSRRSRQRPCSDLVSRRSCTRRAPSC